MEDNWTPPSDAEVTDWSPPSDAQVVDETVKKKVTPSPSQVQSSSNGLNLLSGVIPSGKALLTGEKEPIDLTNAPIAEDESTRTDKFIRKPIDKKKVDEIYNLSKQNESLIDEFAKSHFVLDNLSQSEAIKQLNDLYAKREQAKDPQTAQAIDTQIEVIKSQPVEKQPSIQESVLQNAQKYGSQPQDFNRPEIPMNPLTPNQILERNGMKTANTVGELHDRYIESANKLNELRPELDKTATELDAFKKEARTADFKTDKSGNKTLEGLADIPEAFGHGFGGTMKSIEQGFVNLLGDKQDRIDYAKKRYLEDNILYPTRTKGMATSGSEMVGGVAPYVISTAVLPQTALLGHVIINGLTMGASGYGNGYYEMFAKQKQQGVSDEEADAIAMQNAKFEGAKETAIGASLPFMGGAGSKLFLAPAEKSAMKQFLATQGVIIPTFTAGKLASNVYQKYGLGEKDVNLGDGLAETAENGLILGAMMEFAHKAPPKLKELYRANLSEQYPSIQQSVDKAVKDGVMDASQGYAFTEKLKRDFAVFNAMPKGITTEQKLAIEPEVKQIIELSSREPSAVESPEVTKDKIVQLQKQVAEKLGTPLTEKELEEKVSLKKKLSNENITKDEKLLIESKLKHFDAREDIAKENETKLAEEKKVAEAETPTNVGVEEGSVGVGGDVGRKPIGDGKFVRYNPDDVLPLLPDYKPTNTGAVEDYVNQVVPNDASVEAYKTVPLDAIQTSEKIESKDRKAIDKIKEGIKNGDDIPPLVLDFSPVIKNGESYKFGLMDGHHRYIAYKELGIKEVPAAIVTSREHYTFETNDTNVKTLFGQSLKETTKAETPTETIQEKGIEEAGSVGGGRDKSDADIEKRMAELEGAKIGTPELAEFNALEKEMEKRERDTVFNVPLENVNDAVDTLMKKEKEQPNGYGSFIEKRDARETKEVADRYLNAKDLTDAELKQDFSDAVRGNPTTWYADGLKMREALKEATNRGIDTRDMLAEVTKVYEDAGYDTETAKSVVAGMIKPILVKSQKMDKSATTETGKSGSGDIEIAKRVNNLGEFDNEIRGVTNQRRIPNEIKERYIEALRTLAINKEIGIDHPQAKRYESVYDILDANEKKKEPNKKFNKEDTFSEKSKSYFTPHELIPNVGESFDDAQKRAEKHFGMKSPYPIELIKEAKEIFSGFSYASEGFNDYVYERMQESTKKTTEPSLSQKENKLVTEEIKTAIDNGEITREQADDYIKNNDGAKSESIIEDIERKAESEDEKQRNEAIDQADKLIGEAVTRSEGKAESSNEKVEGGEVKKTVLTKRLYEGKIRESVKSALEEYGLTREVENQSIAEKKGKQFVEEFGEDISLDAIKSGDISGGEAVVVLDEVAKSLERKMLTENDPVKMSELVAKQAEVINTLENIARKGGQFNAMLKKVYQNSDLGYNYEAKVSEWKAGNSGFIPKEVEARFKELDTQMKDLRKRIAETELKLREAEERQAFDNIVAEVRQKPKTERSGKRKIAEGLDELTNALGVKLSAVGDKKASATKALIKIGEGLIEEGIATAKNVAEKIREYVEDKFKGKIDIKEYEPDVLKHFEETLPKITERNGKIHIPDKLIKELVKNGAETIEDLVSQVKEIAKEDFPDITDREIRDSITKYGKTQNPTKDEILSKISRMKRIGRLISQLEDVQNKIRPLKSGLQRERMDAEERAMNKQLREELRNLPVDEETLAGQIRTVLDARKQGVQNRIEDLQREIEQGEKTPKNQRTIADDEALTKLKEQLEKVKAEHQEKFAEQNEAEKEAKRLSMAKKNTQNRIEELTNRLREGDFSKVEKKRLEPDIELSRLRFEKEKIQHEYDKEFEKDRLLKRTKMEKFGDFALEAWGMSRILKATADLSFIYVQGKYALTHPKIASKAFVESMKLFASEKRAEKFIEDIRTSELYPIMKDSKLSIPEPNAKINASEELSYSGWLNSTWKAIGYPLKYVSENAYKNWDKVNPSKAFERASIGYLNTVRVLRFSDGVKMLELRGQTLENSPKEYKNMADFVNTFTGRASLGSLEQQSEMLARVFFSPRNWASVFKQSILLPRQMYKWRETGDEYTFSVAQKMAFRDVSAWVGLSTTMVMMAAAILNNDDDESTGVEFDPRSSDFAKIKLGDTRVDPFGGYLSPIIMASRIAMDITHEIAPKYSDGGYKNKDGKIVPLGKGYVPTKKELLEQVAINKLNPSTSALYSYLAKKEKNGEWVNEYGKPYDFKEDLKLYPMMADMIMEIYLEDPTALNGLLTFGAYFGLPVSKYGDDTDAQRKKKELEKKKD